MKTKKKGVDGACSGGVLRDKRVIICLLACLLCHTLTSATYRFFVRFLGFYFHVGGAVGGVRAGCGGGGTWDGSSASAGRAGPTFTARAGGRRVR